jgi:hypothetical protein
MSFGFGVIEPGPWQPKILPNIPDEEIYEEDEEDYDQDDDGDDDY